MLKKMFNINKNALLAFAGGFVLLLIIIASIIWRLNCVNELKKEFLRFEKSLLKAGYELGYEDLDCSFFGLFSVKNFEIISPDFSWKVPEITAGSFWGRLKFNLSDEQFLNYHQEAYNLAFSDFSISFGQDDAEIYFKSLNFGGLFESGPFELSLNEEKKDDNKDLPISFKGEVEISDIKILPEFETNLPRQIEKISLNYNVIGRLEYNEIYRASLMKWLNLGGFIEVEKLILNWQPLSMVARGELFFNENMKPSLHLQTSSKGLLSFVDKACESGTFESKGCFVVKILLNNKSFKLNEDDEHLTLTTPINLNNNTFSIENIALIKNP